MRAELDQARRDGTPFDLVIINPYSVYIGADVQNAAACAEFLNEWLNPILTDFNIGVILIHHTPKTNFQHTDRYKLWDWMYSGAGCAGITNWARALLAIKPETENMEVFKFIAAKRGQRIDDWSGAFESYFAWSSVPGLLRWEDATAAQIARATAAAAHRKSVNLVIALKQVPIVDPELKKTTIRKIAAACHVGRDPARDALEQLIFKGKAFDYPIDNPNGHRKSAGVCQTCPPQP